MRASSVWVAATMTMLACGDDVGGAPGAPGDGKPLTASPPPAPTQLPDGGMSSAPTDLERFRTQLQWFAANVKSCEVTLDSVRREYASHSISISESDLQRYDLRFVLGGPAATDTYRFPVSLRSHYKLELGPGLDPGETRYVYGTTLGYSQDLILTVGADEAWLWTWNADGHVAISCRSLPF